MSSRWSHCVEKGKLKKGPWTFEEDIRLLRYIRLHGDGRWSALAKAAGLQRCGKSCRLRWVNYLRPGIKRGNITPEEERVIIDLHARWGNRWSLIAERIPGRTDNEIKNYWRSHLKKKLPKATTEDTQNINVDGDSRSTPQLPGMPQLQAQDKDKNSLSRQTNSFQISSNPFCSYDNHHGVKLDIPAASPFTRISMDGIALKDAETDNDELQFCTQSSFMESGVKAPRIENDTGGPQTEAHALPPTPILCSFPWEIPIENDGFHSGFSYSTNFGGDQQLHAPHEFESDAGLDLWPDIILWNMCPFSVVELDPHLL